MILGYSLQYRSMSGEMNLYQCSVIFLTMFHSETTRATTWPPNKEGDKPFYLPKGMRYDERRSAKGFIDFLLLAFATLFSSFTAIRNYGDLTVSPFSSLLFKGRN